MARRIIVKEGQRYAQHLHIKNRPAIWKVGSVTENTVPIAHALLVNVDDPLQTKTISCMTLANRSFFEMIADAPATAG